MTLRLDHIQLAMPVGQEDAARAFWTGAIGLEEIEKPATLRDRGGCWFRLGTHQLHLGVQADFVPAQKAHPAFVSGEIDGLAASLVGVTWDNSIPGRKRIFVADPFGNRLEFIEDSP